MVLQDTDYDPDTLKKRRKTMSVYSEVRHDVQESQCEWNLLRDQMSKELERIARRDPLHPITAQEKDLLREGSTKFSQPVMDHLTLRPPLNPVFNGPFC